MEKERKVVERMDEDTPQPPINLRQFLTSKLEQLFDLVSDDQKETVERMRRKRYGKKG